MHDVNTINTAGRFIEVFLRERQTDPYRGPRTETRNRVAGVVRERKVAGVAAHGETPILRHDHVHHGHFPDEYTQKIGFYRARGHFHRQSAWGGD